MATTTNYGWTTPDDTALVKDGAAAIRTLGSSADTTVKNLNPETTLGDIAYRSSTANVKTRLGLGTAGQVLTVNSGATAPEWSTLPASGGMTLISNTVASAISSLSLSSIPATYKNLMLTWTGINHSAASTYFNIRLNNDSGANYSVKHIYKTSGTFTDNFYDSGTEVANDNSPPFGYDAFVTAAFQRVRGYLIIENYASTTLHKSITGFWSNKLDSGSERTTMFLNSTYQSLSAVSSIDVVRISGAATFSNATNTSIRLYGIS
jgi:hypothetical protein